MQCAAARDGDGIIATAKVNASTINTACHIESHPTFKMARMDDIRAVNPSAIEVDDGSVIAFTIEDIGGD